MKLEFLYIQEKKTFSLDAKAAGSQKKSECDSSGPPLSNSQNCSEGGGKKGTKWDTPSREEQEFCSPPKNGQEHQSYFGEKIDSTLCSNGFLKT